jgi:predicted NUDIX family phosphoesterase
MAEILVVPKNQFLKSKFKYLYSINQDDFYETRVSKKDLSDFINEHGLYMDRNSVETNEDFLQIIPYMVVKRDLPEKENEVFIYTRLKQGNEARLHAHFSAGIGGHVDWVSDSLTCIETLNFNVTKELNEELEINTSTGLNIDFCGVLIYDNSNEVGRVHLGCLIEVNTNDPNVGIKEVEKIEGGFVTLTHLKQMSEDPLKVRCFENWTFLALKQQRLI